MPRNLDRRVEIVFPVEDEQIRMRSNILDLDSMTMWLPVLPLMELTKQDRGKLLISSRWNFAGNKKTQKR